MIVRKGRNFISQLIHVCLNLLLAAGAVLLPVLTSSPILGLLLILVSKWRVFFVRTRYLFVNLKANLVDFIIGFSVVVLSFKLGSDLVVMHYALLAVYALWLLVVKPLNSDFWVNFQGWVAVFLGTTATVIASADSSLEALSLAALFVIGYGASRHILCQKNDLGDMGIYSLIVGLMFAEIGWISFSWSIVYTIEAIGLAVPQLAIVLTILAAVMERCRSVAVLNDGRLDFKQVAVPIVFGAVTILALAIWFSEPNFNLMV